MCCPVERLCDRVGLSAAAGWFAKRRLPICAVTRPSAAARVLRRLAPSPSSLSAFVRPGDARHWALEWSGPLGSALEAMRGLSVSDIEIEPFKLEDYVLKIYSGPGGARA
jgi:hypothetical protein